MQFKIALSALALAAVVSALEITSPADHSELDFTKKNVIQWTTVNTDPPSFDIYLVDMTVNPSFSKLIASNIKSSAGSYTMASMDVPTGEDYQINFESNIPQNEGILAQSGQFTIVKAVSSTSSAPSSGTTGTATTGSSASASASAGSSSASGSPSASATGSSSSASSSASGTSSPSKSGSSTATGANASSTGNAASKMTVSGGVAGLFLGALALIM